MGYPLRSRDPSRNWLITIRTEGRAFFMRPSKRVNKIIGGIIARYQEIFGIEIYAYTVMSNHKHLLANAPRGNLDEFMENVNREIARRINYKLKRRGRFWSRRYRAQAVLVTSDLEEAFLYTVTNSVKHGAARHPSKWLGLCSYEQNLTEKPVQYSFYHYSEVDEEKKVTYHDLKVSPLPSLKDKSTKERKEIVSRMIEDRTNKLVSDREAAGQGFATPEQVRAVDPFESPKGMSNSSAGNCYSKDAVIIKNFKRAEAMRRVAYSLASLRYRLGDLFAKFPDFTFKPPLHRIPRTERFKPLPANYLITQAA